MDNYYNNQWMPLAFALALADEDLYKAHSGRLTEAEKEDIINRAKDTKSKEEVQSIINELSMKGNI